MNALVSNENRYLTPHRLYQVFKYTIFLLLSYNIVLWFQEDLAASSEMFDQITWRNVVEAYSATFDTAAWVILLWMFELETAIIPDEKLKGRLKWLLTGLSGVCYLFIVYSAYGYWVKLGMISSIEPFQVADLCSLVGGEWNFIASLDDYPPLDAVACAAMQGQALFQVTGTDILATAESHRGAFWLGVIDVINAVTWLIVVALLEVEVLLQLKDRLTDRLLRIGKFVKGFFYLVLFLCAAYWGYDGTFLDFWDAFLWLVAFIFIELNIFQWHEEVEEAHAQQTA